jgi:NAD(P)-dependent dehydrogenase (short-subunit alcohol dehydrogenase family)
MIISHDDCFNAKVTLTRIVFLGCIINVSSVVGLHGNIGQTAYAASKAGIIGKCGHHFQE